MSQDPPLPDPRVAPQTLGRSGHRAIASKTATKRLGRAFFLIMALVMAAVVLYGFSLTIGDNLLHPSYPRPWILYLHAAVFSAWVPFFILQTALVQSHRVDLHRRLGQWGLIHGAAIPPVGVATAVVMARVHLLHGEPDAAAFFPVPLFDMAAFTIAFTFGAYWRRRPEYHRRLMFMATCALTAAAFGRLPALDHAEWFYAGVDGLGPARLADLAAALQLMRGR